MHLLNEETLVMSWYKSASKEVNDRTFRNIFPNKVARSSSNYNSVPFDGLLIFVYDLAAQTSASQAGPKSKKSPKDMNE